MKLNVFSKKTSLSACFYELIERKSGQEDAN